VSGPHLTGPQGTQGQQGAPGQAGATGAPGHSPALTWQGDQIAIDGSVTGPHLTGPQGAQGPQGNQGPAGSVPLPLPVNEIAGTIIPGTSVLACRVGGQPYWAVLNPNGTVSA
jgi:hypothetical protein